MAFTDNFTDTNGTELQNHTPSGGTAWTIKQGTSSNVTIQSNECSTSATTADQTYWCDDQGDADCYTQFVTKNSNSFAIPACLRMTDSGTKPTYLGVRTRSNVVSIMKSNDGIFSNLGSGTTTVSSGDTIRIEASGDDIKAFINSTEETSIGTVTETQNNTVTQQGTAPRNNGGLFDDFEAGVLAAPAADLLPLIGPGGLIGPSILIGDRSGLIG